MPLMFTAETVTVADADEIGALDRPPPDEALADRLLAALVEVPLPGAGHVLADVPGLEPLRQVAAEIFILIRDAYRKLADADSRQAALAQIQKPAVRVQVDPAGLAGTGPGTGQ